MFYTATTPMHVCARAVPNFDLNFRSNGTLRFPPKIFHRLWYYSDTSSWESSEHVRFSHIGEIWFFFVGHGLRKLVRKARIYLILNTHMPENIPYNSFKAGRSWLKTNFFMIFWKVASIFFQNFTKIRFRNILHFRVQIHVQHKKLI